MKSREIVMKITADTTQFNKSLVETTINILKMERYFVRTWRERFRIWWRIRQLKRKL